MTDALTPYEELAQVTEEIPVLLRERRRALGLSLRGAAAQLGVSQNTVMRIEYGEDYNSRVLPKLLRWLGTFAEPAAGTEDGPVTYAPDTIAIDLTETSVLNLPATAPIDLRRLGTTGGGR